MTDALDQSALHRAFSVRAYNEAADLLFRSVRTEEEALRLLSLAHVAYWHRSQRPDVTDRQLSIGLWMLSRAHAVVGEPRLGLEYGRQCLALAGAEAEAPYFVGCAHEAIARNQSALGDKAAAAISVAKARTLAEQSDDENRALLLADLKTIAVA